MPDASHNDRNTDDCKVTSCPDCGSTVPIGLTGRYPGSGRCRDEVHCLDRQVDALRADLSNEIAVRDDWKVRALRADAEVERMRPVVDDYLRQAANHERRAGIPGAHNSLAEQTMIEVARAFRAASSEQEAPHATCCHRCRREGDACCKCGKANEQGANHA